MSEHAETPASPDRSGRIDSGPTDFDRNPGFTVAAAGEATRAVHQPPVPSFPQRTLSVPIWRASSFVFDSATEFSDVTQDPGGGYTYGRVDTPTSDAFAEAVAALEGVGLDTPVVGQAFSSGMAAVHGALAPFLRWGAHVVAPTEIYGSTQALLVGYFGRFGVTVDFVDYDQPEAVRAAVRPGTAVVYAETLVNPTMAIHDLPLLAEIAHDAGALLIVDSTFASPVVCRPLEHGADIVIHSATKYIGGHSDSTGGVAVARPEIAAKIRYDRVLTGPMLAPDEAFLLRRGLQTLPLRMERQCSSALLFAQAIDSYNAHDGAVRVEYPGLPGHRHHQRGLALFDRGPAGTRFGACVTVTLTGDQRVGLSLCDHLRLALNASSLGGTHTMVSHVASTTHREMTQSQLADAGIGAATVRFSIGLEDPNDLIADVRQALDAALTPRA
jgi:cystathionine beta-lyase/cystathionine gamma-synthase